MSTRVFFVNAFTNKYYKGNQAAVVPVTDYPQDQQMLALAREFGFSETAFVKHMDQDRFGIRWFTPEVEVDLCGHASLASAKVLFTHYVPELERLCFDSRSGELIITRRGDRIELDFPSDPPVETSINAMISEAVSPLQPESALYCPRTKNLLLIYPDPDYIRQIKPDFQALLRLQDPRYHGIIVSAAAKGDPDYICRYFAPWEGINEDPVTGSAQTCLGPFWRERLNRDVLSGYQASLRGGSFQIGFREDRVLITGSALIWLSGELADGWQNQISSPV